MMLLYRYVLLPAMLVIYAWFMWREWRQIRGGTAFTADEQTVLGFQMILLLPVLLSGFIWYLHPLPYVVGLAVGFVLGVSLLFIALTSIIYRVSILRGRRQSGPQRSGNAIAGGVVLLCIMLVTFLITQIVP